MGTFPIEVEARPASAGISERPGAASHAFNDNEPEKSGPFVF